MHEAFWNGLFDTRWEDAPLGPEAIRLVLRLRDCGYAERTRRDCGHAVVHLGRVLHAEVGGADRVLDEAVVEDFIDRHLPVCRCYRRTPGRRQEHVRSGLVLLVACFARKVRSLGSYSPSRPTTICSMDIVASCAAAEGSPRPR